MPLASWITPRGHLEAHMPQAMQRSWSITACWSSTRIAPAGQAFSQIPQPMQPELQDSLVSFAGALPEQKGWIVFSGGMRLISCCGQILTHFPQPTHFSWSTEAGPFSFNVIAFRGQAAAQLPPPRQPKAQAPGIPFGLRAFTDVFMAAQSGPLWPSKAD